MLMIKLRTSKAQAERCCTGLGWAAHSWLLAEWDCHVNSKSRILVALPQSRVSCCNWASESLLLPWGARRSARAPGGMPLTHLWVCPRENGLPTACAAQLLPGCQSLLHWPDLLDQIAGGRKYQKVWVIKTLSCNIIKGVLKSMTSIGKDIFHTLSAVGDEAEQRQVKQGVLLMKVLVQKAVGDKMS